MRAYWLSEKWREAWALTAVIVGITALASKTSVWMAEASAELVNAIAFFHHPDNATPLRAVLTSAGLLMLLVLFKDAGLIGTRHLFSTTLHRKWRGWLDERFNAALLDRNHTHFHIQNATRTADGSLVPMPDNIEQRLQESIKGMTGGAIGLAMGIIGVFTSLWFVGEKLIETSGPVSGLDFLGSYGSAVLALTAVVLYVPFNTYIAVKVGRALQRLTNAMQQAEGSYRGELTTFLRRSFHVAATRGEAVQKDTNDRLYSEVDHTWSRLNWFNAGYMSFELVYNFMAARIVSYAPGLIPYMNEKISLKGYITGAELVNSLIAQCSWFIHVMPEIATLRTNARRVTELAQAIERVQSPDDFYRQTGRSDFRFGTQHSVFGLTVRNLELMHIGPDVQPFLSVPHLRFRRGEWTFVKGESGCGKTSLIKALNGLWPHGGGEITLPEGATTFYATQDVRLPPVSLKQLVCLPAHEDEYSDTKVAALLYTAGLGEFIEFLLEPSRDGKIWEEVLSGGQKQKLVLARILLHQPGLLFLDEATSALDVEAKAAFHQSLKDACPAITVISIMHEADPPKSASGDDFYDSVLHIADGVATKRPLIAGLPAELTAILEKPVSATPLRKRVPPRQHLGQKQE